MYNYQTRLNQQLTYSPEREYSPTITPDLHYISCIIQRENGAQDLGKYPIGGGAPEVIINQIIVGYHAWVDSSNLVVFVLGQPNSLRWYSITARNDRVVSENIGRSLHRIPEMNAISFVDKQTPEWTIKRLNATDGSIETIANTLPGREDLAWTPDKRIVMSDGDQILFLTMRRQKQWVPAQIISEAPIRGITRMAINARGDKIAVVVNE